ncbi:hypothetical protein ABIF70_005103 [Bradyrhizobium japonicum]
MAAKKHDSASFNAEKFTQKLGELVDALPSDAEKQQAASQLEILIRFLTDLKARFEGIPSRQDAVAARAAVDKLRTLFMEASSNPVLAAALGVKAAKQRPKQPAISSEEVEHAKSTVARFDSLPIDEIRTALESMSARELQSVANAIGVRASHGAGRDTLVHHVATRIANKRGYRSLRDGADEA